MKVNLRHFQWAVSALLLAGLWLNALAPAGYMIAPSATGWPAVTVCPETHPLARLVSHASHEMAASKAASVDHAAMGHGPHGPDEKGSSLSNQTQDCAFAGAQEQATGSIDPAVLAAALAFVLLLGLVPSSPITGSPRRYLRPPLRAPPVHI